MLLVTDVYTQHAHELKKRKLLVYQKYVDRKVRSRLRHVLLTYVRPELDEPLTLERFALTCQLQDIRLRPLLYAMCQEDFYAPNQIMKGKLNYEIYLINLSKQMISTYMMIEAVISLRQMLSVYGQSMEACSTGY